MKPETHGRLIPIQLTALIFLACLACRPGKEGDGESIQTADTTWALLPFRKADTVNPVLGPGAGTFMCPVRGENVAWEAKDVFNPTAVVRHDSVYLLYRAEDTVGRFNGTSRIGLAISSDGVHFRRLSSPVLYPQNDSLRYLEWEGGIEDPRVVEMEDGRYLMTYTAYDGTTARLFVATSSDLQHWSKQGVALQGRYRNTWSKSGAVVVRKEGSRIIATKIQDRYWMYFGDTNLYLASSPDLIHWTVLEQDGEPVAVLRPRAGYFDSRLVESGPYALITDQGILLLYNSMNLSPGGDSTLVEGAYCGGQALFNKQQPRLLMDRLQNLFIKPDRPYEIEGQINQVCFLEGLVYFHERWLLYYGTADSRIAMAVKE